MLPAWVFIPNTCNRILFLSTPDHAKGIAGEVVTEPLPI